MGRMRQDTLMGVMEIGVKNKFLIFTALLGILTLSSCQAIAPSLPLLYDVGIRQTGSSLEIAMPLCGSKDFSKMFVGFYQNYNKKNEIKLWYAKGYKGTVKNGVAYFLVGDKSSWENTIVPLQKNAINKKIRFVSYNGSQGASSPYVELNKIPVSSNQYYVPRSEKTKTVTELTCDK